jgi:hypothetical protein
MTGHHSAFSQGDAAMDHVLTEHGLRLTYLCDPHAVDALDQERILDDLTDDFPHDDPFPWITRCHLADYDHLVLVTDRSTSRYLAFLAANDGATMREDFLQLMTAFVAPSARGQNLLRRMIALVMLRIGGMCAVPSVIAACSRNPACYRIIQGMARRFTNAVVLPDPDSVAINFHTATLAQRIAREIEPDLRFQATTGMMLAAGTSDRRPFARNPEFDSVFGQRTQPAYPILAVLDLRAGDEAMIVDEARRIYRSR